MAAISLSNPIAWVTLRLRGGWRTLVTSSLAYTGVIIGAILLSVRAGAAANSGDITATMHAWTHGLLGLQLGVLILFAGGAVRNAVRRDFTTRMIESHRLMPTSGAQAIAGYVAGATLQFLTIATANFIIGAVTISMSGGSVQDWLLANGLVALFAFMVWFVAAFTGFMRHAGFPVILAVLGAAWFSQGTLLMVAPGLAVLPGPLIGITVFGIIETGGGSWDWALQTSAMTQLAVAGFCFLGAVRKYRRDDVLAFEPRMGLLILAGWLLLCALVIRNPVAFSVRGLYRLSDEPVQILGTILTGMLVALVPVSGAAWMRTGWLARRARRDVALGPAPIAPEMVAISAAALISLFGMSVRNSMWPYLAMTTAGASLAFVLSLTYLFGIMYRVTTRVTLIVVVFLLLIWAGPFLVDGIRFAIHGDEFAPVMSWISTLSPIGALIEATTNSGASPLPGMGVQFVPAAVLGVLYYGKLRR